MVKVELSRLTGCGGFRDSSRAQKPPSLLSFPSRISRTRAPTDPRSALACAQPPSTPHPRSSSGAAPVPWPADRQALRHHRPQLARRATQESRKSARACARINNWYSLRLASLYLPHASAEFFTIAKFNASYKLVRTVALQYSTSTSTECTIRIVQ